MRDLLLLLLMLLLVAAAEDSEPPEPPEPLDRCRLNQVRGCGKCPWSNTTRASVGETAMIGYMTILRPTSVVAATPTDIVHLPGSYLLLLEMPGVTGNEHVTVQLSSVSGDRILSIRGLADEPVENRQREFRGPFTKLFARKFVLPPHVDLDGIRHQLRDGLLRVSLPILPGPDSSSHHQLQVNDDRRGPPIPVEDLRYPWSLCEIEDADELELVVPEALVGSNRPGACRADESCVVSAMPLADVVTRGMDAYVVVWEMPGVRRASEVEVECWPGVEPPDAPLRLYTERGAPGCIVSVAGVVEDDIEEQHWNEGRVVRLERGGGKRRMFAGSLHFYPGHVTSHNMTYELSDGLLRVRLLRPPPLQQVPSSKLWDRLVNYVKSLM